MNKIIYYLKHSILFIESLLYPIRCVGCKREGVLLCDMCVSRFSKAQIPPLGEAAIAYHDPVARKALWLFKYRRQKELAAVFASLVAETILASLGDSFDIHEKRAFIIVPIPLSPKKMQARGYNQTELIAEGLSELLNIQVVMGLEKIKETTAQMSLPKRERLENLRGAFRADERIIRGARIILIDDIITTGATLRNAEKALKIAGAKKVFPFAVAH